MEFRSGCKAHIEFIIDFITEDGMGLSCLLEILEPWAYLSSMRNVLCPDLVFIQSALKVASDPSFHSTRSAL